MNPRQIIINIKHTGEIHKIEEEVKKFITPEMSGIDIGSGGVPILLQAISIDRNYPGQYSEYVHLKGDAKKLVWFKDNCLDYVFSSHCFEDFNINEKVEVFKEWIRVLKLYGLLILYLPDEQKYREYCKKFGGSPNTSHKDAWFSIETVREIAKQVGNVEEEYSINNHDDYCFFIVFRKVE